MMIERVELKVGDGSEMSCFVARPEGEVLGGLIVLQEAFGVNEHIRDMTQRFAKEGYFSIAPELFHRTAPGFESGYDNLPADAPNWAHMDALTNEGIVADVSAAFAWLQEQGVSGTGIGVVGYCMGGRAAYLANTKLALGAAVSYYGGGIAKILDGASHMQAPILLFWGGQDKNIPQADINAITDTFASSKIEFTNVVFSYAGHGFSCDARASYNPKAAKEAWVLTLQFLKDSLQK